MMKTIYAKTGKFIATLAMTTALVNGTASMAASKTPAANLVATSLRPMDTGPIAVSHTDSRYPSSALFENREGWAVLKLDIDETGKATNVTLVDASDPKLFSRHAMRVVSKHEFKPAMKDGQPVAVSNFKVRVRYDLIDPET